MKKRMNLALRGQSLIVVITAIVVHIFVLQLWASTPDRTVGRYIVDHWEMAKRFSSDTVISINQTPDGYLWIGTSKGLVRFDGLKFILVPFAETKEIYSQDIRNIFVDKEQNLWVGSAAGLTKYNHKTGRFKTFTAVDGITLDGVRCMEEDDKGNLWISFTSSWVNRFANGKFTAFDASHGLEGKKINAIIEYPRGNLLFGTSENGVFTFEGGKFSLFPIRGLHNGRINAMLMSRQGNLWVGTNHGLFCVNDKNTVRYTTIDGLSDNYISSILEDSVGNLWIGTLNAGLNRIKKKESGKIVFEKLLKTTKILCLFEDSERSLWIGTYGSGIKRLRNRKILSYAPLQAHHEEILFSMYRGENDDTWIGTVSGKLFRCRNNHLIEVPVESEISGSGIAAIAEDADRNLWFGTIGKGVFQKKNGSFARITTKEGLADDQVTSIFKDSRGNLWFSTYDGVSVRYPDGTFVSFKNSDGLSGKRVHNVYEDSTGNIWIAADRGITLLTKVMQQGRENTLHEQGNNIISQSARWLLTSPHVVGPKTILSGISVTCIHEDLSFPGAEASVYWIATHGAGLKLLKLKDSHITSFTTKEGMADDFIYRFFEDQHGYFWLMSKKGILRVNKNELYRFAYGGADKINCTSFGTEDGMESPEFNNEFSRNSALRTGQGEFWFITRKGVSIVDPARIRLNKMPPPVVIERVFFDGQPIMLHQETGPHIFKGKKDLRVHFNAITFLSPEKVKFKYKLERSGGKGGEWVFLPPHGERFVSISGISPAAYTFKVTACNAEGVWNPGGASFAFTSLPFFYQTLFFKIGVLLLIIVLSAAFFYFFKKKRTVDKVQKDKVQKYKSSNLNPHFAQECIKKLTHLMEIENVYRDTDLTLQSLAEKLSTKPYIVSQVLNESMSRNFYDFVNYYRIEAAKRVLEDSERGDIKMLGLAREVGFNTTAAFYKIFKNSTGQTPKRYMDEARGET